jgi:hypothetical protein
MFKRWKALPRNVRWLIGGIAIVVVLAPVVVWVLLVPAADWLAHHDVGSAKAPLLQTARDAARGRLLTLTAGLVAVGALVFTARTFSQFSLLGWGRPCARRPAQPKPSGRCSEADDHERPEVHPEGRALAQ